MNNSEKNRIERERLKTQKELYKANKLIRDQQEKEKKEKEAKDAFEQSKIKRPIEKERLFASISLEKLEDNNSNEEVSLSDMLGIKSDDLSAISNNNNNNITNINKEDDNDKNDEKIEDRHYAPDFM
jgi:hypothetical protein